MRQNAGGFQTRYVVPLPGTSSRPHLYVCARPGSPDSCHERVSRYYMLNCVENKVEKTPAANGVQLPALARYTGGPPGHKAKRQGASCAAREAACRTATAGSTEPRQLDNSTARAQARVLSIRLSAVAVPLCRRGRERDSSIRASRHAGDRPRESAGCCLTRTPVGRASEVGTVPDSR